MRRVVVTGLGAVTPLAVGARRTWQRLCAGHSGIVSTRNLGPRFGTLPSQVAGIIPRGSRRDGSWDAKEWLEPGVSPAELVSVIPRHFRLCVCLHDASSIAPLRFLHPNFMFHYAPIYVYLCSIPTSYPCRAKDEWLRSPNMPWQAHKKHSKMLDGTRHQSTI